MYVEAGQLDAAMAIVTRRLSKDDLPDEDRKYLMWLQTNIHASQECEFDILFDTLYNAIMELPAHERALQAYWQWCKIRQNPWIPPKVFAAHMRQVCSEIGNDKFSGLVETTIDTWYPTEAQK